MSQGDRVSPTNGVRVLESPIHGKGVFVERPFEPDEKIMEFQGKHFRMADLPDPYVVDEYLQIGPDLFLGPSGEADDFVNHSCDPNARLVIEGNRVLLNALRHISPDEEISYDYALTMKNDTWMTPCRCGASQCRGVIGEKKEG